MIEYTWDGNGNMLSDGQYVYSYDEANRMVWAGPEIGFSHAQYQYNGLGDRVQQNIVDWMGPNEPTNYALDLASGLTQVLADNQGNTYLYGQGRVMQRSSEGIGYFLGDALGSVRQLVDDNGDVTLAKGYQPYGEVLNSAGETGSVYGYTNEYTSQGLIYLRSRWYSPQIGRFLTRDVWGGDYTAPLTLNRWLYVGANPINFTDPSGLWRWAITASIYHMMVENHYEGTPFGVLNPTKQLEYYLSGFRHRPDMFNSLSGDVYEIEPWFLAGRPGHGAAQATVYVADLLASAAAGTLTGTHLGVPYDWSQTPFHLGTGMDWPGKYRAPLLNFPMVDLVADYTNPGEVLYWIEPNAYGLAAIAASLPLIVPNVRLTRPPNWNPDLPAYQPAYVLSWQQACGYALVIVGGAIVVITIVEDVATFGIGTFDDAVTVPGGLLLIDLGLKMGVPVTVIAP